MRLGGHRLLLLVSLVVVAVVAVVVVGTVKAQAYVDKKGSPAASLNVTCQQLRLPARGQGNGADAPADEGQGATDISTDDIPF